MKFQNVALGRAARIPARKNLPASTVPEVNGEGFSAACDENPQGLPDFLPCKLFFNFYIGYDNAPKTL